MADPTTWTWGSNAIQTLGDERAFAGESLYERSDFTGFSTDFTRVDNYSIGGAAGVNPPAVAADANGFGVTYGAAGIHGFKLNGVTTESGFVVMECVVKSFVNTSGVCGIGPAIFGNSNAYAAVLLRSSGWTFSVRKGDNSGAVDLITDSNAGLFATLVEDTRIITLFGANTVAWWLKRPSDSAWIYAGSVYFADGAGTGFTPAAGYPNQRDPVDAPNQRYGFVCFSTGSAALKFKRVRVSVWGGVVSREQFPVVRQSDGGHYTESDGRILLTHTTQTIQSSTNINHGTFWGTAFYDPVAKTLGSPLTRFMSERNSLLVGDSDGMAMVVDEEGDADYGKTRIWLVTTGTNRQSAGADSTNNTYRIVYQVVDQDLTAVETVTLDSLTDVTFPSLVGAPYEVKIRKIGGTWYAAGLCSQGPNPVASVAPVSPFIVSGSSPTNFGTYILTPTFPTFAGRADWDGCSIQKCDGVWYVFLSASGFSPHGVVCYNLTTGASVGTVPLNDAGGAFVPHPVIVPVLTGTPGSEVTTFHRISHDNQFTRWGNTFGTNTWVFGDFTVKVASPTLSTWEFAKSPYAYFSAANRRRRLITSGVC